MVSTNSQINLINLAVNVKRYSTCVWHFVDATRCRVSYYNLIFIFFSILLTINAPIPKNGQIHSNNLSAAADELFEWAVEGLILKDPFISESCIEIKIELNFYFHTSLWCLRRFYEGLKGLPKTFWGTTKNCENKNLF